MQRSNATKGGLQWQVLCSYVTRSGTSQNGNAVTTRSFPKLNEAGLTEKHLLRNANDANEVVLLFEATNLSRAKAFAESAALREARQRVGIVDEPDIYFLNG